MLTSKRKYIFLFIFIFISYIFFASPLVSMAVEHDWYFWITLYQQNQGNTFKSDIVKGYSACIENREKINKQFTETSQKFNLSECIEIIPLNEQNSTPTNLTPTNTNYVLLEPLPDGTESGFTNFESDPLKNPCPFGKYMNILIKLFIGICAVLAMIMIIYGGIQYMTSIVPSEKGSGKDTITHAIFGLIVALGAYLILYTINPNLLNFCLDKQLSSVDVIINGESDINPTPISKNELQKISGINCPGTGGVSALPNIASSFIKHITYDQSKRNTIDASTIYFDCSSFASQVYSCAGLPSPGNTTSDMFKSNNLVTNLSNVQAGDLLGWKKGENNETSGHVFMSLGGDSIIEVSNPPGGINTNAHVNNLSRYKDRVKYIIKAK